MISIEANLLSIHLDLLSIDFPSKNDKKGFQLKSIYVQLLFLLNFKNISWKEWISIEINLFPVRLNLLSTDFIFQPQRNLLIRKGFNWNQFK